MCFPEGWSECSGCHFYPSVLCLFVLLEWSWVCQTKIFIQAKAILLYRIGTKVDPEGAPAEDPDDAGGSLDDVLQVFRIFKLARVLKLARHSPGLQAIAYTLQHSYKELALLIFLMCISGIIIGALAYFIEIDNDSGFTSIPTAFYWVVITMTTVGYGDIYPTSG